MKTLRHAIAKIKRWRKRRQWSKAWYKSLKCGVCGEKLSPGTLTEHLLAVHLPKGLYRKKRQSHGYSSYVCQECQRVIASGKALVKHCHQHHPDYIRG